MKYVESMQENADADLTGASDDSSTRQRVLASLMEDGPLTAVQLADELDMTTAGVRRHLTSLYEEGLVELRDPKKSKRGRGRPAHYYVLSSAGRAMFGQAYDELAVSAIEEIESAAGSEGVRRLTEKRMAPIEDDYMSLRAEDPDKTIPQALAEALNNAGYFASEETFEGEADIYQNHCPVAKVAAIYPQFCTDETEILSRLAGPGHDIKRVSTIAAGSPRCRMHIVGGNRTEFLTLPNNADLNIAEGNR